jgi:hypothetical protein
MSVFGEPERRGRAAMSPNDPDRTDAGRPAIEHISRRFQWAFRRAMAGTHWVGFFRLVAEYPANERQPLNGRVSGPHPECFILPPGSEKCHFALQPWNEIHAGGRRAVGA